MFVVCTGRHRRFEMMLRPGEDPREMVQENQVWSLMSRWITREDDTLWRRASYRFQAQGSWQETEGVMAAWWRRLDYRAAIVRPDHYVYAVVASEAALRAELHWLSVRRVATLAM